MVDKNSLLAQKNTIINQHVLMTMSDLQGKITDISEAYLAFTGYKRENLIGKNHKVFRNYDLDKKIIQHLWDVLIHDGIWKGELKNNKASGEEFWVYSVITPIFDENGTKVAYLSILKDITHQKRLEDLSVLDPITLLHNRRHFDAYFKRELNRSSWKDENLALLLIGVDSYIAYREFNGKILADKAIINISHALKEILDAKTHELFKVTQSEFAIILTNSEDDYILNLAHTLQNSVERLKIKNPQSKISNYCTISIGGTNQSMKENSLHVNDIYNMSDVNLTSAQKSGGNKVILKISENNFNELKNLDLNTKLPNRAILMQDISLLEEDAMLIVLHVKQMDTLKSLYGYDFIKDIISQKATQLRNIIRDDEVSLYALNLQEFAILVTNKNFFEKYLLLLEHSILINNDCYMYDINKHVPANFTAGISY